MSLNRRLTCALLIGSAFAAPAAFAQTAAFPTKPIRIIVPYPAGGATDVATRLLAPRLQEELKQTIVIENRPGASGNLGMNALMQSAPDGHTLAMSLTGMLSINPATYKQAGFTSADVVRHPLVARIVDAYDKHRSAKADVNAADVEADDVVDVKAPGSAQPARKTRRKV